MNKIPNFHSIIFLFIFLFPFSCYKNAVTGKTSMTLIPEAELIGMSEKEYQKFLQEHPPLPESDEPTINAWCMPGGKVVVYTGILPVTQDDPSLAVVMGHEIAHAIARHGNQRMSQALLANFGISVLATAMGQNPTLTQQLFLQSVGIGTQLGMLKFSRNHETEADKMGLIFAAMAGYNPEAAIGFWKRMAAQGGQKPPEFLSTHPSDETRIRDLQLFMPEAKKYYKPR
jgi:predicted Zn-dependent protease